VQGSLDQVNEPADLFRAEGAYDGNQTSVLLAARFGSMIKVIIPPPKTAASAVTRPPYRRD
jgi:hypothetical protein